ncbi:MAG: energy transducer TonB [Deltaproteobacteria bacterium]|nr:energy transducer TonB [Deltaproteobacteria bacterium]
MSCMNTAEPRSRLRSFHVFLCASLLVHAGVLMLPLKPPITTAAGEPFNRLFAVELLMPEDAREENATAQKSAAPPALPDPAPAPQAKKPPAAKPAASEKKAPVREATVSLDRLSDADAQYRFYLGHLRSKISAEWQYPPEASNRGLSGTVSVRFSIAPSGRLTDVSVTNSSAHSLLDDEALRTIRAAAPFHPFPQEFTIEKLNVSASFEYEFSGR